MLRRSLYRTVLVAALRSTTYRFTKYTPPRTQERDEHVLRAELYVPSRRPVRRTNCDTLVYRLSGALAGTS